MKQNKVFGSSLIITSIATGANMFVLLMLGASVDFITAVFLLMAVWALTTITGLLTLEVTLHYKEYANGFSSMAAGSLGKAGKVVVWICCLSLLYAQVAAYISGASSLSSNIKIYNIQLSRWFNAVFLISIVGGIIFLGNGAIDLCNRGLIAAKGLFLSIVSVLLMPHVNLNIIFHDQNIIPEKYLSLWMMIPALIGSFKFHIIIPSLSNYIGRKPKELKRSIIIGTTAALIISLFLLIVIMATVPAGKNMPSAIWSSIAILEFIRTLSVVVNNKWFVIGINGFYNIALSTSFFMISFGLFDFLADGFKRPNSRSGRLQTVLLTFVPPFVLGVFYPQGFIWVLKYAAIFPITLIIILPALMAYKLRKKTDTVLLYQVFGGNPLLIAIMVIGILLLILSFFSFVSCYLP